MSVNSKLGNLVRLGDYIELITQRNSDLKFGISDVCGISNNKEIMPTRANVEGTELHNFFVIQQDELIYNSRTTRMGDKIGLGFNDIGKTLITSWNNTAFRVKPECKGELLPLYLFIYFKRTEFDRYTRYNSWGSSTEIFSWDSMCDIQIPLPDIDVQQELVDTYNGLKALAEQNEALIQPLTKACQAYIVDCKRKYPEVELGEYIEEIVLKVGANNHIEISGINLEHGFMPTVADMNGIDKSKYKIVPAGCFACNLMHIGRDIKIPIAFNNTEKDIAVSPAYFVFKTKVKEEGGILESYLEMLLNREEFGRLAWFHTDSSIRGNLLVSELCDILIPLPDIDVQQAIVNLYNCAEEARNIANEAREKMKTLCPALVQMAINEKRNPKGLL